MLTKLIVLNVLRVINRFLISFFVFMSLTNISIDGNENAVKREKIILGIDPGTNVMGYGLISVSGNKIKLIQYGVVHLHKYGDDHFLKLQMR